MSAYIERKNKLHQEIIDYHNMETVLDRPEKEIYINCATFTLIVLPICLLN